MKNKFVSIFFVMCIFVVGIASTIKAMPYALEEISTNSYNEITSSIDTTFTNRFAFRRQWVNVNGLFLRIIAKTYVENEETDVFKMDNGMLLYASDKINDEDLAWYSKQVMLFDEELGDTPLLYVNLPYKIKNGDSMMPVGVIDYANSNANKMIANLCSCNVNVIDAREYLDDECTANNEDYYGMFYKTDQHWTNRTALMVAEKLAELLQSEYDFTYQRDGLNISSFDVALYENWFLGSFGKKAGACYDGVDDYELLTPLYETNFSFYADSQEGVIRRKGTFEEALLDKNNLEKDLFKNNTYETYTGGNYALTKVVNKNNPNGKKLLLIRDSFSCSMMPFLSLSCREIDAIDPRMFDKTSILEFTQNGNYDLVMIAYNPTIYGDLAFSFFN